VIIESPYEASDSQRIELNLRYLRACLADCMRRGESPFASHGLYTQPGVLRDKVPEERMAGIHAGFAWRGAADATVVYTDLGTSTGMGYGIRAAERLVGEWFPGGPYPRHVIEYRTLPDFDMFAGDPAFATDRWGK
jgi:hypothetical protein